VWLQTKVCNCGLWLWLYTGSVCDYSTAQVTYAAVVRCSLVCGHFLKIIGRISVMSSVALPMVSELKKLLETSDDDGIRRQARGALEALGVVVRTTSSTAKRSTQVSAQLAAFPSATR